MIDRRRLIACLLAGSASVAFHRTASAAGQIPSLPFRIGQLFDGIDRVESLRAVKRLQLAFAHYLHFNNWRELRAIFTEGASVEWDGTWLNGRREISGYFREVFEPLSLHTMLVMAPTITMSPNGWRATGRWHEVRMMSGEVAWAASICIADYERGEDGWKIARLRNHPIFAGPFATGWQNLVEDLAPIPPHFTPLSAGTPETGGIRPPGPVEHLGEARHRIAALLAEDQVRNLQHIFGYYLDRKMWEDVVELFAADGVLEIAGGETFSGRRAISTALEREGPPGLRHGELNDHPQLNVIVDVAPSLREARVRGFDLGMTGINNGEAAWTLDYFDNRMVCEEGVWKIAEMRLRRQMRADYFEGWNVQGAVTVSAADADQLVKPSPFESHQGEPTQQDADHEYDQVKVGLARAAAFDAIENISSALGGYIDDARSYDLSRLFTRDGWRKSPGAGLYQGADRIWKMQLARNGPLRRPRSFLPMHLRIQPVIHVEADGRSARLRTRLLQFNSIFGREGSMIGGLYEDCLSIEDGVWKFTLNDIYHIWRSPGYRAGWARLPEDAGAALSRSPERLLAVMPPDKEIEGPVTATFPKITPVLFHYDNPVSGRAPRQYVSGSGTVRASAPD